jgi:multiple sugar transport system permease protein
VPSYFGSAFNIFLLRQYFYTIPYDLDEAAVIDGCSKFSVFWRILLPIVRPALVTVAIFQITNVWNDFMGPLIFLNQQKNFTLTLGLNLFKNSYRIQWDHLMAAATVITSVPLIIFFIGQKYLIGGIAATGIKG